MYSSMEMNELSDDCLREKLEMRLNHLLRSDHSAQYSSLIGPRTHQTG